MKVGTPYVVSKKKGGSIEKGSVVQLASETAEAQIYYTIDGALPELHKTGIKVKKTQYYSIHQYSLKFIWFYNCKPACVGLHVLFVFIHILCYFVIYSMFSYIVM